MSMAADGLLLALLAGTAGAVQAPLPATVSISTSPHFHTDDSFVGATIDWWRDNDPAYGPKFGLAGALTLDLTAPGLQATAAALAPGLLRVGGTPADGIVYEVHGGECASVPVTPKPTCSPNPGVYSCDKCGDHYGCLRWERWVELLQFGNQTGMRLVFGLNGCRGRASATSGMDFRNIEALLNKTVAAGLGSLLHGVELGNELIKGSVDPAHMAKDFATLRSIVDKLWSGLPTKPLVAGADEIRNMDKFLQLVGPGVLDAATWHMYGQCGHDPVPSMRFPNVSAPGFALQPVCLAAVEPITDQAVAVIKANAPLGTKRFIGEAALTGGGGRDSVTDAFVSSMWYADWLGYSAERGVHAVMRETLVGGYYGVVNHSTFEPNPDAFTMALFNKLMGPGVLVANVTVAVPGDDGTNQTRQMLRAYAHQVKGSPGAVALLLINLGSNTSFAVDISTPATVARQQRLEWHLTAPAGDIAAKQILLNGELLQLATPTSTVLPPMPGRLVRAGEPITVTPASVVFVTF